MPGQPPNDAAGPSGRRVGPRPLQHGCTRRGTGWAEEALTVARASGSAEEESHALTTLGILEHRRDAVDTARSLLCAARRRAAAVGSRVLELRALCNLSSLELDAGNLAKARAVAVDAAELAERAGLSSSVYGIEARLVGSIAHYQAGEPQRNASPAWRNSAATTLGSRSRPAAGRPISPAGRATWIGRVRSFERPQKSTGRPAGAGDST